MTAVNLTTRAAVRPATTDEGRRTVEVVFATGAGVPRHDWRTGEPFIERLSMDPKHIRLARLSGVAPVLDTHRSERTANVLGVVENARVERGQGIARLRFSERAEVEPIWRDVVSGVLRSVSVGYVVHKWKVTRGTKGQPEVRTAIDWEPYEVSLVPIPADADAQTRAVELRGVSMETEQEPTQAPATSADVLAERQRSAQIDQLCQTHGVAPERRAAWLRDGADVDDVREAILADIARRQRMSQISTVQAGDGGRELDMVRDAADALSRRLGVEVEGDGHRNFGDARVVDLARRILESRGTNTGALSANEIAKRAMSTSDFASVLAIAGEKTVRKAYGQVPLAHRMVLRRATAMDFRDRHSVGNGSAALLPKIEEGARYESQAVSTEVGKYKLQTHGAIIPFTRQAIVNDDVGIFESAARNRGRACAETERELVWSYILGNPAAPDGSPVFDDTAHGNYPAASATPISTGTLAAARKALRSMKSVDGFATNGLLRKVVVSAVGEMDILQLLEGYYMPTTAGAALTAALRQVDVYVEPLLSDTKKDWMGFAEGIDSFEYAYLAGQDGPHLEQRVNWDTDAVELKVRIDVGVGCVDHRGVYYQRES